MTAWKWLDGQMDPFMSLEIMVPIETLGTLIALERTLIQWGLLRTTVHLLHLCTMATVEARHHVAWQAMVGHAAQHGHLTSRAMNVRHDWADHVGAVHRRQRIGTGVWTDKVVSLL